VSVADEEPGGWVYSAHPPCRDGRYVAFESASSNLVADDTNDTEDVFVQQLTAS
jgi:hypothetical protein